VRTAAKEKWGTGRSQKAKARCVKSEVPETEHGVRRTVHDYKANDPRCAMSELGAWDTIRIEDNSFMSHAVLRLGVPVPLIPVTHTTSHFRRACGRLPIIYM